MTHAVSVEQRDDALILTFRNGPTNALTAPLRAELIACIENAGRPPSRILLVGNGSDFSSHVPLEPDRQSPRLAELCSAIERAPLPVIAVLTGQVLGAGAEVALAARGRVGAPDLRLGFPEVTLGLCPQGGTTLRLPRLIGSAAALDLLLAGRPVKADAALTLGLVDQISPTPLATALSLLTLPARRGRVAAVPQAIAASRRAHASALPAVKRLIGCVEAAALLPVEAHLAFEAVAREDLEASPEAAGLCAVARAERRAARQPPAISRRDSSPLSRLVLTGADPALTALARAALARGVTVAWSHPGPAARTASLAALDPATRHRVIDLSPEATDEAWLQIHAPGTAPALPQPEDGIAHVWVGGAEAGLGLALAPTGPVCELALPAEARPESIALAFAGLRHLGWRPLPVGRLPLVGRGMAAAGAAALHRLGQMAVPRGQIMRTLRNFGLVYGGEVDVDSAVQGLSDQEILARWLAALANEGLRLLDQGLAQRPSDIDLLLVRGHGFPPWHGGPMHLAGRRGLMALRRDLRLWAQDDPVWSPPPLLDRLIQKGQQLSAMDEAET